MQEWEVNAECKHGYSESENEYEDEYIFYEDELNYAWNKVK